MDDLSKRPLHSGECVPTGVRVFPPLYPVTLFGFHYLFLLEALGGGLEQGPKRRVLHGPTLVVGVGRLIPDGYRVRPQLNTDLHHSAEYIVAEGLIGLD